MPQGAVVEALAIAVAARVPVLLWGAPGTGKTSAIRAMSQAAELPCETVIAAIREPSDFAGLPIVHSGAVRFAPPRWAERLAAAGSGVLFLDEISTAPPAVQAALLRVVLERTVGDLELPADIAVVAAANPPEQAADGWDLSAPLANRFCHLDWEVDAADVAHGLAAGWAPALLPDLRDLEQRLPATRGLVAAFLNVRRQLVLAVPTEAALLGRGWPSPRTWEMCAILLAATDVAGGSADARFALARGAVGAGPAVEMLTWAEAMDLPDPETLLQDPESFTPPERGDRLYAVLSAVAAAVAGQPTPERWLAAWRVLARAGDGAPDVAASAARLLVRCRPDGTAPPPEARRFAPVLRAAGLLT